MRCLLLSLLLPLFALAAPRLHGTVAPVVQVEPLVTTPGPEAPKPVSAPKVVATTMATITMRPKKLRIRKVKTTTSPPQSTDPECLCDCAQADCADAANNSTDERITLRKGPKFYLTVNGKSPNGQRLRRGCCGCGRGCCCGGGGGGGGGGCCCCCDCCGGGGGGCGCCHCCGCCMPCCDMQPRPCMCCPQRRCFCGCGCCCNRCCPYCNFCCNGMRPAAGNGRKKREVTAEDAAASVAPARTPAARKMLAETQRAFVKREKRQNRNRESPACPRCPCAWCSRSSTRNLYASAPVRDDREPADFARSGAPPSAAFPRGGGATRDFDYPYAPDVAEARPRFRSYAAPDKYSAPRYSQPDRGGGANPDSFHPRARNPQGGPVRGSGPFARALQMTSPFPWMRNWVSDQIRMRHRILGYEI